MKFTFNGYGEYESPQSQIEFSNEDFYSLDTVLAHVIGPSLKKFRECAVSKSIPAIFCYALTDIPALDQKYVTSNNAQNTWENILDAMIKGFDLLVYDSSTVDKNAMRDIKEGLRLFAAYYSHLWT